GDEPRVRRLVVDDEPGVDVDRAAGCLDRDRGDVTAGRGLALEDRDLVTRTVEAPRGGQPAHAGADDGDPHAAAAAARSSSARSMPAAASFASLSKALPANGSMSRSQPVRPMSAV